MRAHTHTHTHLGIMFGINDMAMGVHDSVDRDQLGWLMGAAGSLKVSSVGRASGGGVVIREALDCVTVCMCTAIVVISEQWRNISR